jgi:hypothetical protein
MKSGIIRTCKITRLSWLADRTIIKMPILEKRKVNRKVERGMKEFLERRDNNVMMSEEEAQDAQAWQVGNDLAKSIKENQLEVK